MGIKRALPSQEPIGWMALHSKLFSQCRSVLTPISDPTFSRTSLEVIMQDTTLPIELGSKRTKEIESLWTILEVMRADSRATEFIRGTVNKKVKHKILQEPLRDLEGRREKGPGILKSFASALGYT
ncbi:hypothetical protein PROFUN_08819 [Planoprotostelium fungivorum]|uniref:Uncharacterized protein n=1 Tax=Planoprotostelium fungivorum TaxID=1890364 RepID=A0A2P6MVU3_9EUKA|nr:hypothetical protein PROFUN_08819 [Planoprotostelium fungivorum]